MIFPFPAIQQIRLFLIFAYFSFILSSHAQVPKLLADLTPGNHSSEPSAPVRCGSNIFFTANDGLNGHELWKSDGTPDGTVMVKDLCEGFCGSNPKNLCDVNGILFFTAYESDKGTELWRSDGTEKGTYRVKDINTGSSNFSPRYLTKMGNLLFFTAHDGTHGAELWVSDGTEKGTSMVKDIIPGGSGAHPQMLTASAGKLYFKCSSAQGGKEELWCSDGTNEGTKKTGEYGFIHSMSISETEHRLFFVSENSIPGVKKIFEFNEYRPGWASAKVHHSGSSMLKMSRSGTSKIFFSEGASVYGFDLQTGEKVQLLIPGKALINDLYLIGEQCIYTVTVNGPQNRLTYFSRITNGTVKGNLMLADWLIADPVFFDKNIFFSRKGNEKEAVLYYSRGMQNEGIDAGVRKVSPEIYRPQNFCILGNRLFFTAEDQVNGKELWFTDENGKLEMLKNINTRGLSTSPFNLTASGTNLFFMTGQTEGNLVLWGTDGTGKGTRIIHDFGQAYESPGQEALCGAEGKLFVILKKNVTGKVKRRDTVSIELWAFSFQSSPAVPVKSFTVKEQLGSELHMAVWRDRLYFTCSDFKGGEELWISDGTPDGTHLLKDILRGKEGSRPRWLTPSERYLYFTADNFNEGRELWRTDGTEQGTVMVHDIWDGGNSSDPVFLCSAGTTLYFSADDGRHGHELWLTDGTASGTKMVADIRSGAEGSFPEEITAAGNLIYFAADNGKQGMELWCTDGRTDGTKLVYDIFPGGKDAAPGNLLALNGILFFVCNDGKHGAELWKSSGTAKSTSLVKDIQKGNTGSGARNLIQILDRIYFIAADGENNPEIWKTGAGGTGIIRGTYSETNTLPPMMLTRCGNRLYFIVDDHAHGTELWFIE